MSIIEKISDTEYQVGKYRIIEKLVGSHGISKWLLIEDDKFIADFYEKHTALRWANLMYTCGHLVSQGTRELLKLVIEEEKK
jgi:hypothetical protein